MRGSLHAHILCWFERRQQPPGYHALPPVERRLQGTDNRQRPQSQEVNELTDYKEDNLYHVARVGRIATEMARPYVRGIVDQRRYGGWDYGRLRIAGLARTTARGEITHRQTLRATMLQRPSAAARRGGALPDRWSTPSQAVHQMFHWIQTKMALHCCSTKYCLQSRSVCRFFFPTGGGSILQLPVQAHHHAIISDTPLQRNSFREQVA